MVVVWMVCNAILAMAVSEAYGATAVGDNWYLKFILWSVAILAIFRALGSGTFGVINCVEAVVEGGWYGESGIGLQLSVGMLLLLLLIRLEQRLMQLEKSCEALRSEEAERVRVEDGSGGRRTDLVL